MKDGYKKVFWGLFITTFNIKLGIITILPAFLGWIIASNGFSELNKKTLAGDFSRAYTLSMILIIVTLFSSLISVLGGSQIGTSISISYYPLLIMAIELVVFHSMLAAAIHNFQALGLVDFVEKYIRKDRTYIILMGLSMTMLILALTMLDDVTVFLAVALAVITRVYLLYVISSIREEDYEHERYNNYKA